MPKSSGFASPRPWRLPAVSRSGHGGARSGKSEALAVKKILLGVAAAMIALPAAPAAAADMVTRPLPPYAPPPAPSALYGWTGGYVGINAGYDFGKVDNLPLKPRGVLGGVQGGYNWQTGQFVLGAETDLQLTSADDTFAPYQFSNPWFGTVRGRIGWAFSNVLVYA